MPPRKGEPVRHRPIEGLNGKYLIPVGPDDAAENPACFHAQGVDAALAVFTPQPRRITPVLRNDPAGAHKGNLLAEAQAARPAAEAMHRAKPTRRHEAQFAVAAVIDPEMTLVPPGGMRPRQPRSHDLPSPS